MTVRAPQRKAVAALALALALLAASLAGCAKKGPPSGGPPDITPPTLVSSSPDSGAARVPTDADLSLTFSEGMEPRSTGEAVALAPRVDIRQRRWSKRTLTLVLDDTLARNQTYTLFVGGNARDLHGNAIVGGAAVVFTTADSFPRGLIEGEIQAQGFPAAGTYLWCYDADRARGPDSSARDFDAVGLADKDGRFRIAGLRVPGRWKIWAFADLNGNRSFEPATDVLAPADTVFALTAEHPIARNVVVHVVNPRAPGRVTGRVTFAGTIDSTLARRVWAVPKGDSTHPLSWEVRADDSFSSAVPGGTWTLRAFLDRNRDGRWQRTEVAGDSLVVEVPPATEVKNLVLHLSVPPATPVEGR